MTTTIPDPQIYRAAADVIRENGWCQQGFFDRTVSVRHAECPVDVAGALNLAGGSDEPYVATVASGEAQGWLRHLVAPAPTLTYWNDIVAGTVDDVLDLLTRAASAAESALAAQDGGAGRG